MADKRLESFSGFSGGIVGFLGPQKFNPPRGPVVLWSYGAAVLWSGFIEGLRK